MPAVPQGLRRGACGLPRPPSLALLPLVARGRSRRFCLFLRKPLPPAVDQTGAAQWRRSRASSHSRRRSTCARRARSGGRCSRWAHPRVRALRYRYRYSILFGIWAALGRPAGFDACVTQRAVFESGGHVSGFPGDDVQALRWDPQASHRHARRRDLPADVHPRGRLALGCCQCALTAPRRGSLVARVLGGSGACCCAAFCADQ